jgi:hypothetical protein
MRILVSRGIGGIDERTRGATQRWFDMVDWRSAHVGSARLAVSRSIEGYARKLEGEVKLQHPASIWVERQENKSVVHEPERLPTTSACAHHLLQIVRGLQQGTDAAAEGTGWRSADPSRHPQQVCRDLAQLLSRGQVNSEEAQWLARQVGSRLPPGWGATWTEKGCSELEGTPSDQRQLYLRAMEVRCVECSASVKYDTPAPPVGPRHHALALASTSLTAFALNDPSSSQSVVLGSLWVVTFSSCCTCSGNPGLGCFSRSRLKIIQSLLPHLECTCGAPYDFSLSLLSHLHICTHKRRRRQRAVHPVCSLSGHSAIFHRL